MIVCKGKILLRVLIVSVVSLHFSMQGEDIFEHSNAKCSLCTLQSTCRPMCNVLISFITLLNIFTHANILVSALEPRVS